MVRHDHHLLDIEPQQKQILIVTLIRNNKDIEIIKLGLQNQIEWHEYGILFWFNSIQYWNKNFGYQFEIKSWVLPTQTDIVFT